MGLFSFLLGGDSRRSLKKLDKMATQVEALEPKYQVMSDAELKDQTNVLKDRLAKGETLDDILYDAFAALREAAWRVLKMKHFHVQIIGGICLHQGRIAEMRTGEGKTLVATLPSYLNALSGKGVHVVTVNDYLAKRDAEWMGKVHRFMGLKVGVIVAGMSDKQKQEAYACDVVYGTNNEFGFDYLRDNLKPSLDKMVMRELNFAIVDEVDSILIDEARTPLIISGPGEKSSSLYESVDRFVRTLSGGFDDEIEDEPGDAEDKKAAKKAMDAAKRGNFSLQGERNLAAAEAMGWDYLIDRKDKTVQILENGAIKAEKFFNLENLADIENADLNHHIQQALKAHKIFHLNEEYIVADDEILIVDEFTGRLMHGRRYSDGLHQAIEAKEGVKVKNENKTYATITFQNFFRLYNKLSGMTGTAKTEEAEFRTIYSLDVIEIPTNRKVQRIDMQDMIYSTETAKKKAIVKEIMARHEMGQPVLVGTTSVEKSEEISKLLRHNGVPHNILNAKNHEREAEIVAQAGRLGAVTISTNMAGRGTDILLGGNAEYLAKKRLREENVEHDIIEQATSFAALPPEIEAVRDRYNELYVKYKAQTDEEKEKVIAAGGLCIIGTERHESRRIDTQLRGRSGRQGDVGLSVFFLSLEDDLVKRFGGEAMKRIYEIFKVDEDECLSSKMVSSGIANAQKVIEGKNFGTRKNVLQYDEVMNEQRKIIYAQRISLLKGEDSHEQVLKYIPEYVEDTVKAAVNINEMPERWDVDALNKAIERRLIPVGSNFITKEKLEKWDYDIALKKIIDKTKAEYEKKKAEYDEAAQEGIYELPFAQFADWERSVLLSAVNGSWIDHIDAMDQLRKGIGLRSVGQSDPVIAYKIEGHQMFEAMVYHIQRSTITRLLKTEFIFKKPEVPEAGEMMPQFNRISTPAEQKATENAAAP
ncbi:MAG: preprotein translocase subunit SecA, partial [Clostridia bacterium]|nr:preprotein translocase subunit SecA [Clostridia bacterium]